MFEQRIEDNDNPEFPGHQLIVGYQDGVEVWRSWSPEVIPIEARLNVDHPQAVDARQDAPDGQMVAWVMPDSETFALMGGTEEQRLELREAAAAAGLDVSVEAGARNDVAEGEASPTSKAT